MLVSNDVNYNKNKVLLKLLTPLLSDKFHRNGVETKQALIGTVDTIISEHLTLLDVILCTYRYRHFFYHQTSPEQRWDLQLFNRLVAKYINKAQSEEPSLLKMPIGLALYARLTNELLINKVNHSVIFFEQFLDYIKIHLNKISMSERDIVCHTILLFLLTKGEPSDTHRFKMILSSLSKHRFFLSTVDDVIAVFGEKAVKEMITKINGLGIPVTLSTLASEQLLVA